MCAPCFILGSPVVFWADTQVCPYNFVFADILFMLDCRTLLRIPYGMYIIGSKADKNSLIINAQMATVLNQLTSTPIRVATCLAKETLTHEYVSKSLVFSATMLAQSAPMELIGLFGFKSGKNTNKFNNIIYKYNLGEETQCPIILDHSLIALEASVEKKLDLDTHTLFIGIVNNIKNLADGTPMTYEYYHTVIKGKSPPNAPTYVSKINCENQSF
jgi:ferric-chelate reductase [NAD(P)H]